MLLNSYEARLVAQERCKDMLRDAERERLARKVKGFSQVREWWLPAALIVGTLLGLIVIPLS